MPVPRPETAPPPAKPIPTPGTVNDMQTRPAYGPPVPGSGESRPAYAPKKPHYLAENWVPVSLPGLDAGITAELASTPPATDGAPAETQSVPAVIQGWFAGRQGATGAGIGDDYQARREGSAYIPVDSWVYPELLRLYSMGFADTMFLAMRPWTRLSVMHMLDASQGDIMASNNEEAKEILAKVSDYLAIEDPGVGRRRGRVYGTESVYARMMGISGPVLRDSYHLGMAIVNDYGRPYATGFNPIIGTSTLEEYGRFSLYVRGEFQHTPATTGYPLSLATYLSQQDGIDYSGYNLNQATIPEGAIAAQNPFRLMEATLSVHVWGHEISGGKSDAWQGPALGGSFAWSNNAENIYSFHINRVEPLKIPLVSWLLGPMRYEFFYGSLKGHTYPNDDWVHSEMISFHPTPNFEFGFQRTIIFGGKGHEPVTLHTFLKGFFDPNDTVESLKYSRDDPGARFSSFNFSWRLPFISNWATLYADSECHDDVSPVSAPRRAGWLSGIYLPRLPGAPKLDLRIEAVYTDYPTLRSLQGQGNYTETIQRQGYTNKGQIFGHWIGREAKGGQAWLTWHLSGNEWIQLSYLDKKTPKDFIPGGTTQGQFRLDVLKRIGHAIELDGWYQYERWKAPIYLPGTQNDNTASVQLTWFPKLKATAP